jgi:hypothetical protein
MPTLMSITRFCEIQRDRGSWLTSLVWDTFDAAMELIMANVPGDAYLIATLQPICNSCLIVMLAAMRECDGRGCFAREER